MPLMYQQGTLLMEWCLDCHRNPDHNLRPADAIYDMDWTWGPGHDAETEGRVLADKDHYNIQPTRKLIDCSTCHR